MTEFCGSEFWNTTAAWETPNPDFTPCFEKSVLIGVPCAFLWVCLPFELSSLRKSKNFFIPWSWINITKITLTLVLLLLEIGVLVANAILGTKDDEEGIHGVDYFYPSILIATLALHLALVFAEKRRGIQSSGTLFLFWLLLGVCALFGFRSNIIFIQDNQDDATKSEKVEYISYLIFYPCTLLLLFVSAFADKPPTKELYPRGPNCCPVLNASFLNKITFSWFESLVWKGFRKNLSQEDMWDLPPSNTSKVVLKKWEAACVQVQKKKERKEKKNERNEFSIFPALLTTFRNQFILGAIFKLVPDVLTFASPQIMKLLIYFIMDDSIYEWKGYLYAALLFVVTETQSILNGQQFIIMYETGLKIRTAITAAVFKKALKLSSNSKKESTVGEIVNLMAVDIQRFLDVIGYINSMWTAPIQIVLCVFFLWRMIGPSAIVGLLVMVILIPLNGLIVRRQKVYQISQMKEKDRRVKIINEILNGIKVLKLYAWEPSFIDQVKGIRKEEVKVLKQNAYLGAGTAFLFSCTPFLVAFFMFMTFVLSSPDNILTPDIVFVSISLLNILRIPMTLLPIIIITSVQAVVSMKRVNRFLNSEELDPDAISRNEKEEDPVVVEKASFAWGRDEEDGTVLHDINLRVKKGSLVGVVGAVGAGKSSLCLAILGEMEKLQGKVNVNSNVAYVPQQAWMQNATLKENILFHEKRDETWYKEVIEACALLPDLQMLSSGDQTEIGEKGINLSGGQKQRVNLARAVYSRADTVLLDDPLSAVDAHVGKHLFNHVIGPEGLLKNKTRILVTHGLGYLQKMDEIIVLKEGKIVERGTLSSLIQEKGDFQEFLLQYLSDNERGDVEELEEEVLREIESNVVLKRQISEISEKRRESDAKQVRRTSSSLGRDSISSRGSKISRKEKADHLAKGKLIKEEGMEKGRISLDVYLYYSKSIGIIATIFTIIFYALTQVFSVLGNILLSNFSDSDDGEDISARNKFLGEYAALGVGQALSILFGYLILASSAIKGSQKLHNLMLENVLRSPMTFFDSTPIGRIVNRFAKDVDIIDVLLPMNLRSFFACFMSAAAIFGTIIYATPLFVIVLIPAIIFYFIIQTIYVKTTRQLKRIESVTRSPIYTHFGESIQGTTTIRAYNKQDKFIAESEMKVDFNQLSYFPSIVSYRWLGIRLEFIGNVLTFFSALFTVIGRGNISGGDAGLSISYALSVTSVLNFLVRMTADVETNIVAVERIKEYTETPQEASWNMPKTKPKEIWPENGVVEFKNYATRYREGLDLVIKDINLKIDSMEKIGIVGRTGAGKSSMTLALFRIIEPAEGTIYIDGVDVAKIGLHDLRKKLTIIPQDPVLFSGTLRMNLDPFSSYTDEALWDSLEHSHLKDFVSGLSSKLDYEISEGGENLSVGQRQLVCLARALLRKTKVLILDEATAAIDLETDDLIQATIRREFADCTVITIAHRLNTIMDSTRILLLEKGEIIEFDTPSNLLKNTSSMFYEMAKTAGLV